MVDGGLATCVAMMSALRALRARGPARLVAAAPVSPPDTQEKVEALADEIVCVEVSADSSALRQFYLDFPQVEDTQVIAIRVTTPAHHAVAISKRCVSSAMSKREE
ncbi:MAG: hypothetical protein ACYDDO_12730 [Acidiferrobacterales bacterium]